MIYYNGKESTPKLNGVDLSRVMYNGKKIWPTGNVIEIQLADTVAGDVCAWDGSKKRFFRFTDAGTDDIKKYTPIGVVVVPALHTDDSTARVISLAAMDYSNPDNGSMEEHAAIFWGGDGYDVTNLDNKTQVPYIGTAYSDLTGEQTLVGWTEVGSADFSTDYYNNEYPNPYDEGTCFVENDQCAPSPYLTGGLKNEIYHSTANTGSALSDINGKVNTAAILAVDNGGSTDWQTATTITNATNTETVHPAAQCCWRYNTTGTTQGDWYLPAGGELGYLISRWKAINASITKISSFGFSALSLPFGEGLWSSTEYSANRAVYSVLGSSWLGNVNVFLGRFDKSSNIYVRAFLAVDNAQTPETAPNGVYVYANNGKLYNPEEWDTTNNDSAVGVAVVTDNYRFAITKGAKPQRAWSDALYGIDVDGLTNYSSSSQAVTDFNGESNTAIIREAASGEDASNNAAHYCYNQTVSISGRGTVHGYLPALGELQAAFNNKSAVDSAMSLIGGTAMPTSYSLWSSTENDSSYAWKLVWRNDYLNGGAKDFTSNYAVPIFPLD